MLSNRFEDQADNYQTKMSISRQLSAPRDIKYTTCAHRDTTMMTPPPTPPACKKQAQPKQKSRAERIREKNACKNLQRKVQKKSQVQQQTQRSVTQRHEHEQNSENSGKLFDDGKRCNEFEPRSQVEEKPERSGGRHQVCPASKKSHTRMHDEPTATLSVIENWKRLSRRRATSPFRHPHGLGARTSCPLTENKQCDKSLRRNCRNNRKRYPLAVDSNYTQVKIKGCKTGLHKPVCPFSAQASDAAKKNQDKEDSEEEHEQELHQLMALALGQCTNLDAHDTGKRQPYTSSPTTPESKPMSDAIDIDEQTHYILPEECAGPGVSPALNAAFEFMRHVQRQQHDLDAKCGRIQTEIKNKILQLGAKEYWRIEQLEQLLHLSADLCQKLFVAEYAYRDLLDEHSWDFTFDFSAALLKLQSDCGVMVKMYDDEVAQLSDRASEARSN